MAMNPRVKEVAYKSPYQLIITFLNNEVKLFDVQPYLQYPIYEALKDESFIKKAHVQYGTIVWNNEIDFDPDALYLESKSFS